MKAEREKREGPDLIDRSQFDEYNGTVPEGMDVGSYMPRGGYCNANDQPFPADGFCSRGVRKEGP